MPHLRLIGLILFITALFLALAAAATQTTQIRVNRGLRPSTLPASDSTDERAANADGSAAPLEFVSVPVVWPLGLAGGLGLLMWFATAPREPTGRSRRRRKRRRR